MGTDTLEYEHSTYVLMNAPEFALPNSLGSLLLYQRLSEHYRSGDRKNVNLKDECCAMPSSAVLWLLCT